jgi:hypothetical protein
MPAKTHTPAALGGTKPSPDEPASNRAMKDPAMARIPRLSPPPAAAVMPGLDPWAFSPEPAPGQSPGPASRLKQRRGYADRVRARRFNIVCCASETSEACKNVFPEQPCHDTAPIIINIIRCSYRYDCVFRKGRPAARGSGRGRRRSPVHSCWPDRGERRIVGCYGGGGPGDARRRTDRAYSRGFDGAPPSAMAARSSAACRPPATE